MINIGISFGFGYLLVELLGICGMSRRFRARKGMKYEILKLNESFCEVFLSQIVVKFLIRMCKIMVRYVNYV